MNSMTAKSFIDTNILVYAASNAAADRAKRQIARGLLAVPDIGFSAQVLQEGKCHPPLRGCLGGVGNFRPRAHATILLRLRNVTNHITWTATMLCASNRSVLTPDNGWPPRPRTRPVPCCWPDERRIPGRVVSRPVTVGYTVLLQMTTHHELTETAFVGLQNAHSIMGSPVCWA